MSSPDRYAVIGNPIAHSRSPAIHQWFAEQTGEHLEYDRLLVPIGQFPAVLDALRRDASYRGLNVTVPFKLQAFDYAQGRSARALAAGAVNCLSFADGVVLGDNTDGIGLVNDLQQRLGLALSGQSILLLGAGGASRGVLQPLLDAGVSSILICNRSLDKAQSLAQHGADARLTAINFADLEAVRPAAFDVVINATSSGLGEERLPVPAAVFGRARLAYDMFYAAQPTVYLQQARDAGCPQISDGLGMLIEQAAESFRIWRGVRPDTATVYRRLRDQLDREAL